MASKPEFHERLEAIETLIGRLESAADPATQSAARELLELVMDLHGEGLARILEILRGTGAPGTEAIRSLGRDDLIASLLVLHGLHPESLEERVARALDQIRPSLKKRGSEVELVSIDNGVLRLKLRATGHGAAIREVVEGAVYQAAPDITSLVIEGPADRAAFVPLEDLRAAAALNSRNHLAGNGAVKGNL